MNSRGGDLGQTPGDGSEVDRGGAGEHAPATGSARVVIGMALLWLASTSFVLWLVVSRERDGLLLLASIFLVGFFWAAGVFTRKFWSH